MVDVGRIHPRLVLPTGQPKAVDAWSCVELVDPRVKPVLKRIDADLRPGNLATAKLTGATLLRKFLEHRLPRASTVGASVPEAEAQGGQCRPSPEPRSPGR